MQLEVYLGEVRPDWVRVELFAAPRNDEPPLVSAMKLIGGAASLPGWHIYAGDVSAERPASDYTPRIIPSRPGTSIPLEDAHILWFR